LKNETKIKSRNIDRFDLLLANLSKVKEQLNKYGI
jgi:hypothetical protein